MSLAAGDFNGDSRADLAISSPGEDIPGAGEAGSVTILPGSATGPTATGSKLWTEDTTGVPGVAEDEDYWGSTLAAGDLTGDGRADLIVGAPNESVDGVDGAGAVTILHGAASGLLTTDGAQLIDENTANVPGTAEHGDGFGASLAVGNFNGDVYGDLAIGDPGESVDGVTSAGTVTVLSGTSGGVSTSSATLWDQNTTGIIGSSATDDDFATDLTAIAVHGGSHSDLVIGDSGETVGTQTDCGAIAVIPGSPTGLTATGNQLLEPTQLTGGSVAYEYFGDTVG
jgi:FG-GAP repeat